MVKYLLTASLFFSYSLHADDKPNDAELKKIYKSLARRDGLIDDDPDIDTKMGLWEVAKQSAMKGTYLAIRKTAKDTVTETFGFVPTAMKQFGFLMAAYAYKMSYGSAGLTWNKLALINNQIYNSVIPFTRKNVLGIDRIARAAQIDSEMRDLEDPEWIDLKETIKQRITNGIEVLTNALPCYNITYFNARQSGFSRFLGGWVHRLSTRDNQQISTGIADSIRCLQKLNRLFDKFQSAKDAEASMRHIQQWLSWTLNSLKHIAFMLEGETASSSTSTMSGSTKLSFSNYTPSGSSSGSAQGLADLLGGGNGKSGSDGNPLSGLGL